MLRVNQVKMIPGYQYEDVIHKLTKQLGISKEEIIEVKLIRESIDARKKPDIFYQLTVDVCLKDEDKVFQRYKKKYPKDNNVLKTLKKPYVLPECGEMPLYKRPVIIGTGPAGLFCGYYLAKRGFKPILFERGKTVKKRSEDVEKFWLKGILNTESNVQFGEGGAGTFSDGKLNTLVKDKTGRIQEVLKCFVQMGAKESILYEQKPHLGTDKLIDIVTSLRESIEALGGEFQFERKIDDFIIENGSIKACVLEDGTAYETDLCILATGHSARDTIKRLYEKGVNMEAKSFAVGFRIQHKQSMIQKLQYGDTKYKLPPAPYKVTAMTSFERGVYSFCMCPGGYVVNASSEEGMTAVNGMSYSDRAGENANSAIIVSVSPKDYPDASALGGIAFQRELEKKAYQLADGLVPVQLYGDFLNNEKSVKTGSITPAIKGAYKLSNLRGILPAEAEKAFMEGMTFIGKKMKGFDCEDAVLAGVESRTSSPVRINRDDTFMTNIKGIYPCGEGAGYAGGITSAAADGILIAEQIIKKYFPAWKE